MMETGSRTSFFDSLEKETSRRHLSVARTLASAFKFMLKKPAQICVRILLPAMAGAAMLLLLLNYYFLEVERYVLNQTDQSAALVLGFATAGLLLGLFLHSVIVASIALLYLGRDDDRGWRFFYVSRPTVRLYAANLRLLLVAVALIIAVQTLANAVAPFLAGVPVRRIGVAVTAVGLFLLCVRVGFFMPAVVAAGDKGPIIRAAWRHSSGLLWQISMIVAFFVVVGLLIEDAGEFLIRAVNASWVTVVPGESLGEILPKLRALLPHVLAATGLAYLVIVVLATAASVAAYRQLAERAEP